MPRETREPEVPERIEIETYEETEELPTKIAQRLPGFFEGLEGTITNVETINPGPWKGIRVTVDSNNTKFAEVLWIRDVTSQTSKLGAFITALGTKPKTWIGKKIRVISWTQRNRKIIVL
jgi:hypothetical protein